MSENRARSAKGRKDTLLLHYCTISTVSSRILKICWPRWPINFLLNSSDLKRGLFFWLLRVTELTVEMVQYLPKGHGHLLLFLLLHVK